MIRKVELSMDEQQKYEIIKALADHPDPNKQRAALILQCTVRHINRMLKGTRSRGRRTLPMETEAVSLPIRFRLRPAGLLLICIAANTTVPISSTSPSFWQNMRASAFLLLPLCRCWKLNAFSLPRLRKQRRSGSRNS